MKPSVQQIGNLLALKRHERPEEGYMEDFLREFHHRRREEAMEEQSFGAKWKQFMDWLTDPGVAKWAYGAGVAYAAVLAFVLAAPHSPPTEALTPEAVHRVITPPNAAPTSQLGELDLRPSSEGIVGEQEF